ncbi:MAG: tRNA preQ1(34) S-adenosylmethionine ribosyltransferase-isomerase QueA [Bdellovibrionaceae bacterium]|nr:tRNA preQ1(34) S-adenosylmethionine ribosyltransferase-isomerase QueA [Pseudobdellovibrionaceae bacterium]
MKRSELLYDYPEELVATAPVYPPRVMWIEESFDVLDGFRNVISKEILWGQFLDLFREGDVLVLNDTKVLKCRVFAVDGSEILFLKKHELQVSEDFKDSLGNQNDGEMWEVLFPSKKYKLGDRIQLPQGKELKLIKKGRPQIVKSSEPLDASYFDQVGELPLPPYIQRARQERHNLVQDSANYQTAWAQKPGSLAAPTASLHFKHEDLENLKRRGVQVLYVTLHVGLGTFLPITVEDLKDHTMHSEWVEIPDEVWRQILKAKESGSRVWGLGTTVTRSLESQALGYFKLDQVHQSWFGFTDLLIQPGFEFKVIDNLLTNFHQPESTLLALVSAFSNLENVKAVYRKAIDLKMRLFSYGDLSVWTKIKSSTQSIKEKGSYERG